MELRIKPAANNQYELRALLIKGAEPLVWFRKMEASNIPVSDIAAFAIPSGKANVLYGCLLVFPKGLPKNARNHKRFQCAHNKLFIPENAALYPQLTPADIASVKAKWIIAHPDFGFVDLEAPINWLELIAEVPQSELQLRQPLEGVIAPHKIVSYSVEIDEEDIANSLLPQKTEEAWMKELPFNLQKVLNCNKREAEKYLNYLAQYPERALALGIPLDVMSTSRDGGWAPFSFRSGWLQSMFGGSGFGGSGGSGGSGSSSSFGSGRRRPLPGELYMKSIFIGIVVFILLAKLFNSAEEATPLPSHNYNSAPEKGLYNQYKAPLIAPQKTVASEPDSKDTLDKESATLHSKYLAAVYKYASQEVQVDSVLKDSIRLHIEELKREIESVSAKIAARDAIARNANLKKVEEELAAAEKKLGSKIRDSIAQLPQQDTQSAGGRNVLYQLALESKKVQLRDSLELAYGLRIVPQDTFTPAPDIPSQKVQEPREGLVGQIIFIVFVFLFVVLIFTKMIRGKTISMGGRQVPFGVKGLLLSAFIGLLVYILYPLINHYGYNWLVGLVLLVAAGLLYRLLASDKTILKSGKNG